MSMEILIALGSYEISVHALMAQTANLAHPGAPSTKP